MLGAATAAVFANDGAALLLTPIVVAILARMDVPAPAAALAVIVATGFVADSTSLPLVISNLVNIVSANFFDVTFQHATLRSMVPVDLVSLVADFRRCCGGTTAGTMPRIVRARRSLKRRASCNQAIGWCSARRFRSWPCCSSPISLRWRRSASPSPWL